MRLTPFRILAVAASFGFFAAWIALAVAHNQPYLGLGLSPKSGIGFVWINRADPKGPAAALKADAPLEAINGMELQAADLVEEPDVAESYEALARFFNRQDQIASMLHQDEVTLSSGSPHNLRITLTPERSRPISTLPPVFWTQIVLGLAGLLIGTWVWSLKRGELAARLLALAGLAALVAAFPSAIYGSRELALPGHLFHTLSAMNHFGTLAFCVAMTVLFLVYPKRLVRPAFLWVLPLATGAIWVLDTTWLIIPGPAVGLHLPAVVMVFGILVSAFFQHRATRNDPAARTALRWFTLSFGIGVGTFVILILLPNLFGMAPAVSQGYAALFVLLFFVGVALGVARYRLFELEDWAFSILFYFGAVILLVLLDAALIMLVALERAPAFGLSLILIALIYLPARDRLARRLTRKSDIDRGELFRRIVDVALTKNEARQEDGWQQVLREVFDPLHLGGETQIEPAEPRIVDEGLALVLPRVGSLAPVRLSYAQGGRRLFSPRDKRFAVEIRDMLAHAIASRDAYEKGAAEERRRIARDMHDNIGAQLLSALHSDKRERKDTMIRETISDLRDIINNTAGNSKSLDEALADLRVEVLERLAATDIELEWRHEGGGHNRLMAPNVIFSLRSILREAVSNTIRHSDAQKMAVRIDTQGETLQLTLLDDGKGYDPSRRGNGRDTQGNGLSNIEARLTALQGRLSFDDAKPGFVVHAEFPFHQSSN
ncbi:ATP-binding protein [Oricola sp.]|uniref:ATP-binding protein n=1 Tax=Oricola sp. TaxID=1979950 RepID=UPI003BAD02FA